MALITTVPSEVSNIYDLEMFSAGSEILVPILKMYHIIAEDGMFPFQLEVDNCNTWRSLVHHL